MKMMMMVEKTLIKMIMWVSNLSTENYKKKKLARDSDTKAKKKKN